MATAGSSEGVDVAIVGGGIVGLATAHRLLARHPRARLVLLEKEGAPARHQTGHNSGVIHSGIYYRPGSLKAQNCRRGKAMLEAFCREAGVPFETCGKVIVATSEAELPALAALLERGRQNGVDCEAIGPARLRELEPEARGLGALHVREAGIVDYKAVAAALRRRVEAAGGEVRLGRPVVGLERRGGGFVVRTALEELTARAVVNCAGLHADRVARLAGHAPPLRIVPFRGEYYKLRPGAERLCRNLIYPVPDPRFPFLGVHFTRMIGGGVECGPNAVLALAREGYTKRDVVWRDLWDVLSYPGFWRLAARHAAAGLGELFRSFVKEAFVEALQRLVPAVTASDLEPAEAGVRAQALRPDGSLVDDFALVGEAGAVHVLNAPSPAATSSLGVGDAVVDACEKQGLLPLVGHRRLGERAQAHLGQELGERDHLELGQI
ncbi:MAG TPA: L-2-hydroxyglutarate oxidase [Polyangiaceae bacterium]|nr:L-2-hydroxyglutarate oxidase [Polyangiaceae bacterium]